MVDTTISNLPLCGFSSATIHPTKTEWLIYVTSDSEPGTGYFDVDEGIFKNHIGVEEERVMYWRPLHLDDGDFKNGMLRPKKEGWYLAYCTDDIPRVLYWNREYGYYDFFGNYTGKVIKYKAFIESNLEILLFKNLIFN